MSAKDDSRPDQIDPNAIARLNDQFRTIGVGGMLITTAGVIYLAQGLLAEIVAEVRAFDAFTPDNDPHGEHDFGALTWAGERLFWKIDCYDCNMRAASPDPTDPWLTMRVLTIMLASEY